MTNANGERAYFAPSADDKSMVLLDQEGNKIQSQLNYTLTQVAPSKKQVNTATLLMQQHLPNVKQAVLILQQG